MYRKFIQVNNITKIANALLKLDLSHWQAQYHLDAQAFILQLQQALDEYLHPNHQQEGLKSLNVIDSIDYTLKNLIQVVENFIGLLTPEAQQHIEQQFMTTP